MLFTRPLWVVFAVIFAPLTTFAVQQPLGDDPFGSVPPPVESTTVAPLGGQTQPPALLEEAFADGSMLAREEELRRASAQALEQDVRNQLGEATKLMKTNPGGVKNALKARLDDLDAAIDLDPTIRAQLRDRLRSAIKTAATLASLYVERGRLADAVREFDEDISIEGLLAGRKSGETPQSFERWLRSREPV